MKNPKHYFKIGHYAYPGDNYEFLIDMDRKEWQLFHGCAMPPDPYWKAIPCDSDQLKDYLLESAQPDTWKKETHSFRKKHQEYYICDGASIKAEWNFGQGIQRRMYSLGVYDEGLLRGCKEGRELVEWMNDLLPIGENE